MIVVTGVTGRVGGAAARALVAKGHDVKGLSRNPDPERAPDGVELAVADLADPSTLNSSLAGAEAALLVLANSEHQLELERNFIEAAVQANVRALVKVSSIEASTDTDAPLPLVQKRCEEILRELIPTATVLRPTFYMQNLFSSAKAIRERGEIVFPLGTAKVAMVDAQEVGEIAATALTDNTHAGQTYALVGDEPQSFEDVAAIMSGELRNTIRYIDESPDAFRNRLAHVASSEWHLDAVCREFDHLRHGGTVASTAVAERLLGRPPATVADFIHKHRAVFEKSN